jgi:ribosomal protein S24E
MKILNELQNKLLKRKEVVVEIESEKNPGYEAVKGLIATQFKADAENIVVKTLKGHFGSNLVTVDAFIYSSKEDKENVERKPKVKKSAEGVAK